MKKKTYRSTKTSNLWWQSNSKKNLHILEDNGNGVPVGDIKQIFVKKNKKIEIQQIDDFLQSFVILPSCI
jgi:hypothetical protein